MLTTRRRRRRQSETPEQIKQWLVERVGKLWPVAAGSLSYRRSPCSRAVCSACERGEGHPSHILDGRRQGRRFSVYVPGELAGEVRRAIERGRRLETLIMEAGERYTQALKRARDQQKKAGRNQEKAGRNQEKATTGKGRRKQG